MQLQNRHKQTFALEASYSRCLENLFIVCKNNEFLESRLEGVEKLKERSEFENDGAAFGLDLYPP